MLTGSLAAAWYGAGRATLAIDLVVELQADRIGPLVDAISGPGVYVSPDAAREALDRESMFNVIDTGTGWKADLIVRKSRPFSRTEFGRRRAVEFEGVRLWVTTPEDLIIAKLEWAKLGGSARQIEDVRTLIRVTEPTLDREYLEQWISALGLAGEWRAARGEDVHPGAGPAR
jgi:hypothetical protein